MPSAYSLPGVAETDSVCIDWPDAEATTVIWKIPR